MLPAAPGRLSMRTAWPSASESFGATRRATRSVVLAGANPTTRWMGFCFGQSCAAAVNESAAESSNTVNRMKDSSTRMLPSSVKILFASQTEKAEVWVPLLREALPHDELVAVPDKSVEIALIATPPAGTFQKLGRPRLVQSLWMGVEKLLADPAYPRGVPLARLVDPGMVAAMSETVIFHVLDWHRRAYRYRQQQQESRWHRYRQYMASDHTVGILGLGELGTDAARKLLALGFNVAGWSRTPKTLSQVRSFSGEKGLAEMLSISNIVVCLLPLTPQTKGVL